MIELRRYQLEDDSSPVTDWLRGLRDMRAVGEGISELRVDIGSGYRVYYGKHGTTLVILLCCGDKSSQQPDITQAKAYWADWKRRNS